MPGSNAAYNVRLSGFGDRAVLSTAWTWLDAWAAPSSPEFVPLAEAVGRVLAESVTASIDPPGPPRAAENGYAVRSADCDGASAYNPLLLSLAEPGTGELGTRFACLIASGLALPSGADAVLPFEAAQPLSPRSLQVLAPVAVGTGIDRASTTETTMIDRGQIIQTPHVGCLAATGIEHVVVVRRPRVGLVVPGAKSGPDALTPMLRTLLVRDGGLAEPVIVDGPGAATLTTALTSGRIAGCALVLIAGRAGTGPDDVARIALEAAGGTLTHHGIALHPGGACGLGSLPTSGRIPLVLLPGDPLACLVAYDILASRLVRRLAGAARMSPYRTAEFKLARKIVSGIGVVDVVPVRLDGGRALPIGVEGGLAGAIRADGFVMVPDASEGYLAGSGVRVHLYDPWQTETALEIES